MIIVRLSGGMANQMFQYALGRVLALKHNVPLKLDTTFLYNQTSIPVIRPSFTARPYALDVFSIDATLAEKKEIPWYGRPFLWGIVMQGIDAVLRKLALFTGWEKTFRFDPHVLTLGPSVYLSGFWQSEKYFAEYKTIIKDDFTVREPLSGGVLALKEEIESGTSVCVHVRRGDIASGSFHGGVDTYYYDEAIAYIAQSVVIDRIYVFSDDIEWVKNNMSFVYPTIYVGNEYDQGKHGERHMALMSACTHFVIANSTFSWWAAWLNTNPHKIVIAPKKWFIRDTINTTDLFPESWIRL